MWYSLNVFVRRLKSRFNSLIMRIVPANGVPIFEYDNDINIRKLTDPLIKISDKYGMDIVRREGELQIVVHAQLIQLLF